jgi:voltage-gated potassium channel
VAAQDTPSRPSKTARVNERAQRLDDRLEPVYLVAALLVIPDVAIEATATSGGFAQIAAILNWVVWLVFAAGLIWTLVVADARWRWLRQRPLDVAIVLFTPPFAPAALLGFRLARLLRLLRLLRLARTAHLARKTFSLDGVKWVAALSALVALGGGAAFTALERGHGSRPPTSTADGMWWAISTMTTVGYGDYSPVTEGGRVIAAVVMLVGIGFVAFLTAAVAQRFVAQIEEPTPAWEDRVIDDLREIKARLAAIEDRIPG